jgi:hypothetical protein
MVVAVSNADKVKRDGRADQEWYSHSRHTTKAGRWSGLCLKCYKEYMSPEWRDKLASFKIVHVAMYVTLIWNKLEGRFS